jgi:hypothetical protein
MSGFRLHAFAFTNPGHQQRPFPVGWSEIGDHHPADAKPVGDEMVRYIGDVLGGIARHRLAILNKTSPGLPAGKSRRGSCREADV